jgi:hypothetical protein
LDTILGGIASFGGPEVGGVVGSVKGLMDTGFSLWSAWNSVANPQTSIKNSLHNDLVQLQDYLVCQVQSIVSAAETTILHQMSQEQLNTFNAFMNNAISTLNNQCGMLNCLNVTSMAPSGRNAAVNDNCVSRGGGHTGHGHAQGRGVCGCKHHD